MQLELRVLRKPCSAIKYIFLKIDVFFSKFAFTRYIMQASVWDVFGLVNMYATQDQDQFKKNKICSLFVYFAL